jgi:hypothetical protein
MIYTAKKLVTTPSISHSESRTSLETSLLAALEHARRLTQMYGIEAREVVIAWDTVEELVTARVRQQENSSAFERYCTLYPDAPECRIYDV